jgi:two-component system KDP operon response regulator KdpE
VSGERVLIVDDEPQIRRALRSALDAHGYTVAAAEDGREALEMIPTWAPDAIVLDLVMPVVDGFEVLRETRTWSNVPIIVLSARGQDPDKVAALDGNVTIDIRRHLVFRNQEEVHLTPTEFDLLTVFASEVGKVFTHRQLLERVWGAYAAENAQQLRVYINYLRRKLEDDPSHPQLILTEPGVGYRLKAEPVPSQST